MDLEKKTKRDNQIESIRQMMGWAYRDLLWFSEAEAHRANQQRDALLEMLSGWVTLSCRGTKPHIGPLSPGCVICGAGGWGCNFINALCTRSCFYCPQDRLIRKEVESQTDGLVFRNPSEHIGFIKTFQIRGVGFSGGEPLLVLDRLLAHIKAIRQELGNSVYLWIYTNGDRLTQAALRGLQQAGLDEVRFDLSARKYDLAAVRRAREFLPTVTVEIPAIPEDIDLVKGLLGEMAAAGVNFLNLHQLMASQHNYRALRRRLYHFLHQGNVPVFESEICALNLLLYAKENQINLPINYCSENYKGLFQGRDVRTRRARAFLKGFEEITEAGYLRSFRVWDSRDRIASMVRRLEEAQCPPAYWQREGQGKAIAVHSDLLPFVEWASADVALQYFNPEVKLVEPEQGFVEGNIAPNHKKVYEEREWSRMAIESWRKLYLEKIEPQEVFTSLFQNYLIEGKDDIARLQKEIRELKKLADWEELSGGLAEIF